MRGWVTSVAFGLLSVAVAVVGSVVGVSDRVFFAVLASALVTLIPLAIQIDVVRVVGEKVREGVAGLTWAALASEADARIKSEPDEIFLEIAPQQLDRAREILERLTSGEATYSYGYERDVIVKSIRKVKRRVYATHDCREQIRRELWFTDPLQRRYLEVQKDLLRERLAIDPSNPIVFQRILVLPRRQDITRSLLSQVAQIAEMQIASGVSVRGICADDVEGRWDEDLVIIDDRVAHRYTFGVRAPYEEVSILVDQTRISELRIRYESLLEDSLPWPELARQLASPLVDAKFYDVASSHYDDHAFGSSLPKVVCDYVAMEESLVDFLFRLNVPEPRVIFDFGCGTAWYIRRALLQSTESNLGAEVIGLEICESMVKLARQHLDGHPRVRIQHEDVTAYARPILANETPLGICTYNTLGVTDDPERFVKTMRRQCRSGWLLLSGFRGEGFAGIAPTLYSDWEEYVGARSFGLLDVSQRRYSNYSTGFRSHWLTLEEIESYFGSDMDRCVIRCESEIGYHLLFRLID
jgi:SAM-dependent methyltransferase